MKDIPIYSIKKCISLPMDELEQDDDFFTFEIPVLISIPKNLRKAIIGRVLSELISMDEIRPIEQSDMYDLLVLFGKEMDDIVDQKKLVNTLKDIIQS